MKRTYLQLLGSFLVGLIVPCLVLQLGARVATSDAQETTAITETTAPTQTSPTHLTLPAEPEPVSIRVLMPSGQTEEMVLEAYLVGVILAEMPTSFDHEALRAQAVVARTYALRRQLENRHPMGAICTGGGCCQAYVSPEDYLNGLGYQEDIDRAVAAVKATEGEVLRYQGELIEATYFCCSGGKTEDAQAVWGVQYPYLQALLSPGEEQMDHHRYEVYFTAQQLQEALGESLPGTPYNWIGRITRTEGGGIDTISIGGTVYTGLQLRKLLNLNSTAFVIEPHEHGIYITTSGKGHRVGMSQSGAQAMALRGYTYLQILGYYYPGTAIDKTQNLE